MKIFNWVHRRFNHKDGLAQSAKKSGLTTDELLEDNVFSNVFDGWKGGILAIGTFGYDPLKDESEENDASVHEEEPEKDQLLVLENETDDHQTTDSEEEEEVYDDVGEDGEEEEANPLIYAAYAHDYEGLLETKTEGNRGSGKDGFEFVAVMKNSKKERTTLAELFSADSEEMQKKKQQIGNGEMTKGKANYKHGLWFAKKLIGEDARLIHKLNRLMRRMLKRKIHPEVGPTDNNPLNSKAAAKKRQTNESGTLLPTKDAVNKI